MTDNKKYIKPELQVYHIDLEECLAVGSTTIKPGGPTNNERPTITDWDDTGINDTFEWHL